jgi:hypothetical protein
MLVGENQPKRLPRMKGMKMSDEKTVLRNNTGRMALPFNDSFLKTS